MSERTKVYASLSDRAAFLAGLVTQLCDDCEDAEFYRVTGPIAGAARALHEAAQALAPQIPTRAHRRWTPAEDERLAASYGEFLRDLGGNTEDTVASLARMLGRTPVAVAARLCHLGIWRV